MMTNNDNGGKDVLAVFGAMIVGALIGGITALLLAPKSGEELRGEISDAAAQAKQRAEDAREQMTGKYEELRGKMEAHMKEHAKDAAEATEELAQEVEEQIEEA
ncbi:MAG: YtxH domain-containing protein [Armatimonadota bacterium]